MPEGLILVVDDEQPMRAFIVRNLEARGYETLAAATGFEALAEFQRARPDLVILDLMMPSMDGLEACRRLRERSTVPILVVTALGEERDRVRALDAGADDCLVKPFGVAELLARVGAALRRVKWTDPGDETQAARSELRFRGLTLDSTAMRASLDGEPLALTCIEFRMLELLLTEQGRVLPHEYILERVWGPDYTFELAYLRVYVGRLRSKLGDDAGSPTYIHTEHGLGYRLGE